MLPQISMEDRQKAIRLYKNKDLTIPEISNLTGLSVPTLSKIYRRAFYENILTARREDFALKPRTPNGQGKGKYIPTGKKRGNPNFGISQRKFTYEQEEEIAKDYYERGLTNSQLKAKWGINRPTMQRIRNEFREKYGVKANAPKCFKEKYKEENKND